MSEKSTEVAIIEQLGSNGMEKTAAEQLLSSYGVPFVEAGKLIEQGRQIVVSDESDTENMALARTTRLALRSQRIAIEKKHDELKADSLAYGKAVDLVQRVALEQIKPVEEHLQLQEKFAEVQQEKRRQERINERTAKLAQYVDDVSVYNYGDMGDDAFALLIDQVRDAKEKREAEEKAAAEKAEQERREREEADKLAREKAEAELADERARNEKKLNRISTLSKLGFSFLGNDGYKFDELQVSEQFINEASDDEFTARVKSLDEIITERKELQAQAAAQEAERVKKIEEQAARDREAAEKAAAEKKAADDAEAKRVADEKAAAEAAAAAPDKERLLATVDAMVFNPGTLSTPKATGIAVRIEAHLAKSLEAYRKLINEEL